MNLRPWARRAILLGSFVAVALSAGCVEERVPISRVQANALAKSFFVGDIADPGDDPEFYMRRPPSIRRPAPDPMGYSRAPRRNRGRPPVASGRRRARRCPAG